MTDKKKDHRNKKFKGESTDIKKIPFVGSDLRGASFKGIVGDLAGVDFSGANIGGTNFENIDLTGAVFDKVRADFPVYWGNIIRAFCVLLGFLSGLVASYSFSLLLRLDALEVLSASQSGEFLENCLKNTTLSPEVCGSVMDAFYVETFGEFPEWPITFFWVCLGFLLLGIFSGVNIILFGIIVAIVSISVSIIALFLGSTALAISFGLIALLGIFSGLLISAESVAIGKVAEISDRGFLSPLDLLTLCRWSGALLGIISGVYLAQNDKIASFFLSVACIAVGEYIGSLVGQDTGKYAILEFFAISFLEQGPTTNFKGAILKGASFKKANLKDYATSLGRQEHDDETLKEIIGRGEKNPKRYYDRLLKFSGIWGENVLYGRVVVNIIKNYRQMIRAGRDVIVFGTVTLGDISGQVSNSVGSLSEDLGVKRSLLDLQNSVESNGNYSEFEQIKMLQCMEAMAQILKTDSKDSDNS